MFKNKLKNPLTHWKKFKQLQKVKEFTKEQVWLGNIKKNIGKTLKNYSLMNIGAKLSTHWVNQLKISSNECIQLSQAIYLNAGCKDGST